MGLKGIYLMVCSLNCAFCLFYSLQTKLKDLGNERCFLKKLLLYIYLECAS